MNKFLSDDTLDKDLSDDTLDKIHWISFLASMIHS